MLSIDSVSRLNFIRSMPQTYKSLHDNEWFELQGYNKVRFIHPFRAKTNQTNVFLFSFKLI